jgi:hypothetical protein
VDAQGVETALSYGGRHGMLGKKQPESWGDALWDFICIREGQVVRMMSQRIECVDLKLHEPLESGQ